MKGLKLLLSVGALAALAVLIGKTNVGAKIPAYDASGLEESTIRTQTSPLPDTTNILTAMSDAIAGIAEKSNPAVVTVFTAKTVTVQQFNPFAQFFGYQQGPWQNQRYEQNGLGSGVIVSNDGYILTNNHVVGQADRIYVKLINDDTLSAKVVGTDPNTDVAVIKVDAKNLPSLKLGDSDRVRVGDIVLAIGSPLDATLAHTVTMGIVSAKGRSGVDITNIEDFIQTDAAINPGNSGGALINARGELIGINTAIASRSGGNQGIGFAIPINMARRVMDSIIRYGKVVRSFLGVSGLANVDLKYAKALGLPRPQGVIVGDVVRNSAADKAGLKAGDIILELDGELVRSSDQFVTAIYSRPPGTKVSMKVNREGTERTVTASLGTFDEEADARPLAGGRQPQAGAPAQKVRLGFEVQEVNPELSQRYKLEKDLKGVVITVVNQGSDAQKEGLRPGDVIVSVNRQSVAGLKDFEERMKKIDRGEYVLFRIIREGSGYYLPLRMN
jgi:serine protease Do